MVANKRWLLTRGGRKERFDCSRILRHVKTEEHKEKGTKEREYFLANYAYMLMFALMFVFSPPRFRLDLITQRFMPLLVLCCWLTLIQAGQFQS